MNEKTVEHARQVIRALRKKWLDDAIKSYMISRLVNDYTGDETGYAVIIYLAHKYQYNDALLNVLKKQLDADEYIVKVNRNRLSVRFSVHY